MSLPLTQIDLRQRSLRLASLIADDLVSRQTSDGQFKQPDFYAKAFAVNLWTRLDHLRYAKNIERALTALKSFWQRCSTVRISLSSCTAIGENRFSLIDPVLFLRNTMPSAQHS